MGMERALRQWNYTVMPPPAFIRECVAGALDEERSHIAAERMKRERVYEMPPQRLTVDEAWEDYEEQKKFTEQWRKQIGSVAAKKQKEVGPRVDPDLVLATDDRLRELERQRKIVEEKYGKGKAVRVRDSVSPEANEGASGTERDTENSSGKGTNNGTGNN
jgi:hypothetical protein